jgi:GntR family transcriptional repressor for pyruvate dehydrogenase complex
MAIALERQWRRVSVNDPRLQPVEKQTLAQAAMERLLMYMKAADFRPGQPLPSQHELARQLEVSRPVLREAMQGLATLGVIEIRPGSGCYVRDAHADTEPDEWFDTLTHEGAIEVLEARMVVEVELAGFAAARATERDFADMEAILDRIKQTVARGRSGSHVTSDFHLALSRAGHNLVLFRMAQLLTKARVVQGMRVEYALPDIVEQEVETHVALLDAVRTRDPDVARLAMRRHLEVAHRCEDRINELRASRDLEIVTFGGIRQP